MQRPILVAILALVGLAAGCSTPSVTLFPRVAQVTPDGEFAADWTAGSFMVCRREALESAGYLDERFFMYAEDVDLSRRIREAGWQLYYLSEAEVMHTAGGTTRKAGSDFSVLMGCESMEKLIEKYQGGVAAAGRAATAPTPRASLERHSRSVQGLRRLAGCRRRIRG